MLNHNFFSTGLSGRSVKSVENGFQIHQRQQHSTSVSPAQEPLFPSLSGTEPGTVPQREEDETGSARVRAN